MSVGAESGQNKLPRFVKRLEDVEVSDGQEVMMFCVVSGDPMPSITWYHNDTNIVKNEEYVFTYDRHSGHIYLVILDCLADDEGEFRCVASNAAGRAVTQCKLRILPTDGVKSASPFGKAPSISVKQETVDKTRFVGAAVSQTREPKPRSTSAVAVPDRHLTSVESVTLLPPDILFHTKKIPGQSKKVASYRTVLRRASDNDLIGYRAKSADQPRRQDDASWKVSNWSVHTKRTVRKAEETTGATSRTQSKMASESSKLFLGGGSSALQPAPVTGLPALQTSGTESRLPVVSSGIKSPSYTQPSYVRPAGAETSATAASSRLYEPPRFVTPLTNQTVRDGDAAALRVRFHGNPTPQLHWFFNQKAVEDEEDFVVRTDSGKGESVLWIKEVFPEDDGEFVCKVENDYGTAVSHCRLTVQCKQRDFYSVASPEFEGWGAQESGGRKPPTAPGQGVRGRSPPDP